MPRLPKRHSLPAQAAEIIHELIQSGELTDTLPGERALAAQLQVGRDTLRSALDILESRNVISPRQHGKKRIILAHTPAPAPVKTCRVAFISPKEISELPPLMLIEVDSLRELLNKRGYEFEFFSPGVFHLNRPEKRLKKMVEENPFDVWILHQCPKPVQQWFQANGVNTIIRGYSHDGIDISSIDEDWRASALHAAGELLRNGHRSIGLLMPEAKLAGLTAAEDGLRAALTHSGSGCTLHTLIDNVDPHTTHNALERAFNLKDRPTAIVGTRARHTLNLVSWLAQRGMSVPKDISYISLSYEHWYPYLTPTICHYYCDPGIFARSLLRLTLSLLENNKPHSPKRLIPEYCAGESVAKIL